MTSILIKNGTLISANGEEKVDIFIEDGLITRISPQPETRNQKLETKSSVEIIDATGLLLLPGLIDCHVHFREPGLEHKATMATEAAAARAGGVLTVCEMPNTIPPTVTVAALADKVRRAAEVKDCDVRFFFGITETAHIHTLQELWTGTSAELRRLKARCSGVKLYLDHSTGNQKAEGSVVEEAFRACGELGIPVVCHCEDADMNQELRLQFKNKAAMTMMAHSQMRPPESEAKSIQFALTLAKKYRTHLHIAHLSTKQGIDLVRQAKKDGVMVTCEVAPHHLFLTVDDYKTLGSLGKMNPPLRASDHRDALWQGIKDGTVDCIATDHAPHTLEEKQTGDPLKAPSGVPGVETMLPLLLSTSYGLRVAGKPETRNTKLATTDLVRLCFENPNHIFNLGKQGIVEGAPAEIVLVDPKEKWTIKGKELHSKCGWTPYEGWRVTGKVMRVLYL